MPVEAPLYPVNLVLDGRPVLVVGGGRVAAQKVDELVRCRARVHVVAPRIDEPLASRDDVTRDLRPYRDGEIAGYRLGITATDDPDVNRAVHEQGAPGLFQQGARRAGFQRLPAHGGQMRVQILQRQ